MALLLLTGCDSMITDETDPTDKTIRGDHVSMETLDWIKSYPDDRMAGLIAIGEEGSLYTATSLHTGYNSPTMKVFKTSSTGSEIWSKRITLDIGEDTSLSLSFGSDMKVDQKGNLLIVGTSMDIARTKGDDGKTHITYLPQTHKAVFVKLNHEGEKLWEYTYGGGEIESFGKAVERDSDGNYYICGVEVGNDYHKRTFIVKLTTDGSEEFVTHYPLGGDSISKNSIIISGGYLYILGNTSHTVVDGKLRRQAQEIGIIKATRDGDPIWTKNYEGGNFDFRLAGFVQDHHHNLVIAATRVGIVSNDHDAQMYILKTTPEGKTLWAKTFGAGPSESALDIAVDSKDNIFVSGWTRGAFPGYTNEHARDPFLVKLSADGTILKSAQFAAKEGSSGNGVIVDDTDRVYLSGFGKLEGQNHYSFLIKYK